MITQQKESSLFAPYFLIWFVFISMCFSYACLILFFSAVAHMQVKWQKNELITFKIVHTLNHFRYKFCPYKFAKVFFFLCLCVCFLYVSEWVSFFLFLLFFSLHLFLFFLNKVYFVKAFLFFFSLQILLNFSLCHILFFYQFFFPFAPSSRSPF